MKLPVTNKSYSICSGDCKVKASTKSLFWSKLQSLCPVAPTNFGPKCGSASLVDAMRVVQTIPKKVPIRHYIQFGQKSYLHKSKTYLEITYILPLIVIIVKVISSLACPKKDLKVLQKETSAV